MVRCLGGPAAGVAGRRGNEHALGTGHAGRDPSLDTRFPWHGHGGLPAADGAGGGRRRAALGAKIAADDPRYQEVADLYKKRWRHFRDEELRQQDPLGAANDEPAHKPEPDVKIEEDHISPDAAMDEIQNLLEAADSIEEYDRILKEHAHLFEAASAFPPDRELLEDIKETTLERLGHGAVRPKDADTRTQRMEDVEDRDRSENRRPDLGSERF